MHDDKSKKMLNAKAASPASHGLSLRLQAHSGGGLRTVWVHRWRSDRGFNSSGFYKLQQKDLPKGRPRNPFHALCRGILDSKVKDLHDTLTLQVMTGFEAKQHESETFSTDRNLVVGSSSGEHVEQQPQA